MNKKYRKLIGDLLEMASEEFANHGCNDVDEKLFEGWTIEERKQLGWQFELYNSEGKDYMPDWYNIPDFALMSFFAYVLNNEMDVQVSDTTEAK